MNAVFDTNANKHYATDCDVCHSDIAYGVTCYSVPNGEVDGMQCVRIVCADCYGKGER